VIRSYAEFLLASKYGAVRIQKWYSPDKCAMQIRMNYQEERGSEMKPFKLHFMAKRLLHKKRYIYASV
jgi:hypothetical protein